MPDQIALALERRARRDAHLGAHLVREQVGERRLAEPGRTREQHVVERVAALARRLDVDGQVVGDLLLAHELGEAARAGARRRRRPALGALGIARDHAPSPAPGPPAPLPLPARVRFRSVVVTLPRHRSSPPQGGQRLLAPDPRSAARRPSLEQRLELVRLESRARAARRRRRRAAPTARARARAAAPAARRRARPAARRSSRAARRSRRSAILRPTPLIWVRRATSPPTIARTSSLGRQPGQDRERDARPDALHVDQRLEQAALVGVGEAVQTQGLVLDEVRVDVQPQLGADRAAARPASRR